MTEFYTFLEHLLYDHECVIIPQFGGFVVNAQDFQFNAQEGKIYPKRKCVAFNEKLKTDDRFLTTEWAKKKSISQKEASIEITAISKELKSQISTQGYLTIGELGAFTLNSENRLSFSPNPDFNADLSVFGLFPVGLGHALPKEKKTVLEEAPVAEDLPSYTPEPSPIKVSRSAYVYALMAFIIGGIGAFFLTEPAGNQSQSSLNPIKIEKKVATPVAVAEPAVPTPVQVDTVQKEVIATPASVEAPADQEVIYLVAASFQSLTQAEKGLKEFKSRGFDQAEIILKNEQTKFYRISLGTEHSMDAGYARASELKASKKVDIWVYKAL
ncbi:HU domain-containing protein [Aquirufa antheringensis]|uniref:HU domain-containing protein n=1 Tax=Aquirufa antheringensis TaxID=2516559 RepID=UPI001032BBF5|nr:SPOR domain-containing protein [Aquirufa antheringensis]TBH70675.1 SPOR domain-containing protein [Aquirufa antheringensis]